MKKNMVLIIVGLVNLSTLAFGKYADYCVDKKQVKELIVEREIDLTPDPQLNSLQNLGLQEYKMRKALPILRSEKPGVELIDDYFMPPSQKAIEYWLKNMPFAYTKLFGVDSCNALGKEIIYETNNNPYCRIPANNDPISRAKADRLSKYIENHRTITKEIRENKAVFIIKYDLQEYCEKAIPMTTN